MPLIPLAPPRAGAAALKWAAAVAVIVHNTMWIVGHFHNMALFNIGLVSFAAVYAFPPRLVGHEWYSESLASAHLWLTVNGGYGMVLPMLVQGLEGAPRRYAVCPPQTTR